jgi:hypothetical protein
MGERLENTGFELTKAIRHRHVAGHNITQNKYIRNNEYTY